MEKEKYYLSFVVNKLPDLTLAKYSVFDGSGVGSIIEKHGIFLRQLHRLGKISKVYFHLLYFYNPSAEIPKGNHLTIVFYATADSPQKLEGIREFLTTSVLSNYYNFNCFDVSRDFSLVEETLTTGEKVTLIQLKTISGEIKKYNVESIGRKAFEEAKEEIAGGRKTHIVCEVAPDADEVISLDKMPVNEKGCLVHKHVFSYGAFLTKREYILTAQNRSSMDAIEGAQLYSILEWEPNENGRLYNVLKLMEGYDSYAALRIDLFPVDETVHVRSCLPYQDTRNRIADRGQGKDDNSETIIKSWDSYLNNIVKFPQFYANVVAFADSQDQAVMFADSVAAEAVESGTYLVEPLSVLASDMQSQVSSSGDAFAGRFSLGSQFQQNSANETKKEEYSMYYKDTEILRAPKEPGNYVAEFLSLYTLEELRPMFSLPILYPGESIECHKETDPVPFSKEVTVDKTGIIHEAMSLGTSYMGYDVTFPLSLYKKHAFIAGVPGAGKTNTMLYLVTTLWRDTKQHIPFLVLEPAKQEYRALTQIPGMEDLLVFSPGADTLFPLHINPFEFPVGLTLAEHIANLNAVFAGAFELPPPSPHFIDSCIEKVYIEKGWNVNERNIGTKEYPTLQELYNSLEVAVKESHYQGETLGNLQSVLEVRVGSLLKREIGNVYNVRKSIIAPEEWLDHPIIIELESLGEGPANFMSLLISTLIREVLKIRKLGKKKSEDGKYRKEIEHIIFYEEAHNLIGPITESPDGVSVNPKISATKYLVKMLAEVRALGEGIVIADQLPTVMAPEVLKNTGLKIGHRITAQDDRELLGGTMSATVDQLEEQGTFQTGEALIFYEGLMKPYKMRMHEWEKGTSGSKYDSPSNQQMYERMKDLPMYIRQISNSSDTIQDKMKTEFDELRKKLQTIVKKIIDRQSELDEVEKAFCELGRRFHIEPDSKKKIDLSTKLKTLEGEIERKKKDLDKNLSGEVIRVCREFDNLFAAYITMSANYGRLSDDMKMCTVNNYVSLFRGLADVLTLPTIAKAVEAATRDTRNSFVNEVNYYDMQEGALKNHKGFLCAAYESACMLVTEVFAKVYEITRELPSDSEQEKVIILCAEFSSLFMRAAGQIDRYSKMAEELEQDLKQTFRQETDDKEKKAIFNKINETARFRYYLHECLIKSVACLYRGFMPCSDKIRRYFVWNTREIRGKAGELLDMLDSERGAGKQADIRAQAEALDILCMKNQLYINKLSALSMIENASRDAFDEKQWQTYSVNVNSIVAVYLKKSVTDNAYYKELISWYFDRIEEVCSLGERQRKCFVAGMNRSVVVSLREICVERKPQNYLDLKERKDWDRKYDCYCELTNNIAKEWDKGWPEVLGAL